MIKIFDSPNSRLLKGEVVYYHFGFIKLFPQNSFDKPFGEVQNNQEGREVTIKIYE